MIGPFEFLSVAYRCFIPYGRLNVYELNPIDLEVGFTLAGLAEGLTFVFTGTFFGL